MERLVGLAHATAERIAAGGLLLVYGVGEYSPDAHHVSVEFMHPVIVGKRNVPALCLDDAGLVGLLGGPGDVAISVGPAPEFLAAARQRGLLVVDLTAERKDDLVAQYHVLWELTHLFLEGQGVEPDADLVFLYGGADASEVIEGAERSWAAKIVEIDTMRKRVLAELAGELAACAGDIAARIAHGGRVLTFGNGGSATDAATVARAFRARGVGAVCLTDEMAVVTALANDVSFEVVFARQIAALARPSDIAVGLSTSGGSLNLLAAFTEARRRGLLTVGMAGYDGGKMATAETIDHLFVVPSTSVHRIQEAQSTLYETLAERSAAA